MKRIVLAVLAFGLAVSAFAQKQGSSVYADLGMLSYKNAKGVDFAVGVGYKYQWNLKAVEGLGIVASAEGIIGFPNKEQKSQIEDANKALVNLYASKVVSKGSYKTSFYTTGIYFPVMAGVNYVLPLPLSNDFKVFGQFMLGPDFCIPTTYKIKGSYNYSQASTQDKTKTNTYSGSISIDSKSSFAVGFSTSLSLGCLFKEHYSLSIDWNYLGSFHYSTNMTCKVDSYERYFMKGLSSLRTKDRYETSSSSKTHNINTETNDASGHFIALRFAYHF